jgi:hypothetical protein
MELRWYLDGHVRFLALCALIPLLSGVIVLGVQRDTGPTWRTEVTIALPVDVASQNTLTIAQWIASFHASLRSDAVAQAVATAAHVPAKGLPHRLHASQQGKTGFLDVAYDSDHATGGAPVLNAAVEETLKAVARPKQHAVDVAAQRVSASQAVVGQMQEVVQVFVNNAGQPFPDQALVSAQRSLSQLQIDLASADPGQAAAIQRSIDALNAQITKLAPIADQYGRLDGVLTQAQSELAAARRTAIDAQSALVDAQTPTILAGPTRTKRAAATKVLRAVGLWAGAGLVLAFGLVVVSILQSHSRFRADRTGASQPA